ncbi:MAG: hypothetical protein ACKO6N_11410 [Myxococcota bacterium]
MTNRDDQDKKAGRNVQQAASDAAKSGAAKSGAKQVRDEKQRDEGERAEQGRAEQRRAILQNRVQMSEQELEITRSLVHGLITCALAPLVARAGLNSLAEEWFKHSVWRWAMRFGLISKTKRETLSFDLERTASWGYQLERAQEGSRVPGELDVGRAYRARRIILRFFAQHQGQWFTCGDVTRRLSQELSFIDRADVGPLLKLYVGKQFLLMEDDRFTLRQAYVPLELKDPIEREAKLKGGYESIGPLSQAYLQGRGELLTFEAHLPHVLWEEFHQRLHAHALTTLTELAQRSNEDTYKELQFYHGGAFLLSALYPWTPPPDLPPKQKQA